MIYKESLAIKEIHEIREKHYEQTKNLNSEERIRMINEGGQEAMKIIKKLRENRVS